MLNGRKEDEEATYCLNCLSQAVYSLNSYLIVIMASG